MLKARVSAMQAQPLHLDYLALERSDSRIQLLKVLEDSVRDGGVPQPARQFAKESRISPPVPTPQAVLLPGSPELVETGNFFRETEEGFGAPGAFIREGEAAHPHHLFPSDPTRVALEKRPHCKDELGEFRKPAFFQGR